MKRLVLTLLLLTLPSLTEAQDRRKLHAGLACSIASDIGDVLSTGIAFHRRPDVVEGNFVFGTARDLKKILIIKGVGAITINGIAIWLHDEYPKPSLWLTFGNCALKSAVTANNLRIAFKVSW